MSRIADAIVDGSFFQISNHAMRDFDMISNLNRSGSSRKSDCKSSRRDDRSAGSYKGKAFSEDDGLKRGNNTDSQLSIDLTKEEDEKEADEDLSDTSTVRDISMIINHSICSEEDFLRDIKSQRLTDIDESPKKNQLPKIEVTALANQRIETTPAHDSYYRALGLL